MKLNLGGSSAQSEGNGGTVELYSNARVFRTPSGSRQGKFHFTVHSDSGSSMCTCEGFQYRGKCKHLDTVELMLSQERHPTAHKAAPPYPVGSCKDMDPDCAFEGLSDE